jgi:hypothetical protein
MEKLEAEPVAKHKAEPMSDTMLSSSTVAFL